MYFVSKHKRNKKHFSCNCSNFYNERNSYTKLDTVIYKLTSKKRCHGKAKATHTHGRRKRKRPADVLKKKVAGYDSGEFQETGHERVYEPVSVQVGDAQRQTVVHHICHYPVKEKFILKTIFLILLLKTLKSF